jgi:hypothetical protein
VEDTFGRPGVRFVPVVDIEPAVTAIAWHPSSLTPLAKRFLAIATDRDPLSPGLHHDHGTMHVQVLTQKRCHGISGTTELASPLMLVRGETHIARFGAAAPTSPRTRNSQITTADIARQAASSKTTG